MRRRSRHRARNRDVFGLLDVGTTKVACLIAPRRPGKLSAPPVLGFAYRRSQGIKDGGVVDLDEAEEAIRTVVAAAEEQAQVAIGDVFLSVACGQLSSRHFTANARIASGIVLPDDVERTMTAGRAFAERDGRSLIHMNRIDTRLDGAPSSDDPRGLAARRLSADLHAVTANDRAMRNLLTVVNRCHLDVAGLVAAPYASALGCTTEDERHLGVTCIDIGGGTTKVAVFQNRRFVFADVIPLAGNHITQDIARSLATPLAKAARIKALYGTLIGTQADEHEVFSYPAAGEENGALLQASKSCIARLIRPRLSSILSLVGERLMLRGFTAGAGRRIVVTGGTAQLLGIGDFASRVLGSPVRVAAPRAEISLPRALAVPAFSALSGLLIAASCGARDILSGPVEKSSAPGYMDRVSQWLRTAF